MCVGQRLEDGFDLLEEDDVVEPEVDPEWFQESSLLEEIGEGVFREIEVAWYKGARRPGGRCLI